MDLKAKNISVDMINIHANIRGDEWELFSRQYLDSSPDVEFKVLSAAYAYRYNWNIKSGSTSAFIGYVHNMNKTDTSDMYSFKLEFNPNKVNLNHLDPLGQVIKFLYNHRHGVLENVFIKSIDVACDLGYPIEEFIVDKGLKRDMRMYKGTMYFGDRHNEVKVYDKQKESSLDKALTRYEMTIPLGAKWEWFDNSLSMDKYLEPFTDIMPVLYLYGDNLLLTPVDRAIILGLREEPGLINKFPRKSKAKYRKILEEFGMFRPSSIDVALCISRYIKDLNKLIENNFIYEI